MLILSLNILFCSITFSVSIIFLFQWSCAIVWFLVACTFFVQFCVWCWFLFFRLAAKRCHHKAQNKKVLNHFNSVHVSPTCSLERKKKSWIWDTSPAHGTRCQRDHGVKSVRRAAITGGDWKTLLSCCWDRRF